MHKHHKRILIIDDDTFNHTLLIATLEESE